MANDPHLTHTVPGIWYAMRLRVNRDDWVVGAAIPGVPGILIGMNPALAWTLTNTGEDVDDLLEEQLSEDGRHYLAGVTADGREEWRPIHLEPLSIKVKGEAEPRRLLARFTHRGPLSQRSWLKESAAYSRQWLPLKDGVLRLPIYGLARSLEEFDQVLDDMRTPSQNVLVMNRKGDILYRASGSGVIRRKPGHRPMPAVEGEWLGFAPMDQRPRRYIRADERGARHVATANQRIWTDGYGHLWESDDRQERLDRALSSRDSFSREDMERLQLDTQGRFRQLLLGWILDHAGTADGEAAEMVRRWRDWDGTSQGDPEAFALAERGEELLTRILLARVQERFATRDRQAPYRWPLQRAWLTTVLEASGDEGLKPFGLTAREVAGHLLAKLVDEAGELVPHPERNRWQAQHPFHAAIPVVGLLFAVDEHPQWGADDLVSAENPYYGPSLRLVWNMRQPWDSTWIFPVGQSGHVGSAHYKDLQKPWFAGERLEVFDDGSDWGFGGQAAKSH
jgi:penicillin amidase